MTPRVHRDLPPFIHEIGWRSFQRLSNELFSHEPDIAKSDEYGVPGQGQHGVDLLALVKPSGVEVAQCKCERSFSVRKIRQASKDFLNYWAHWKKKNVRRFILFVSCDIDRTELQNEMLRQRGRFAKRGISYEIWGATTIRNKLRPHRAIARAYFDSEEIVNAICVPVVESAATAAGISVVAQRLGIFATELEISRGQELEELREFSRAGEQTKALEGLTRLKNSSTWEDHTRPFRARVLRFEAAVRLNIKRDVNTAARLVEEARTLDPNADFQTIDAYLAYCRRDIGVALETVTPPRSAEARNLRWNLLLESGKHDVISEEVSNVDLPKDAETHRILTLLALARGDVAQAQIEITRAVALGGTRRNIQLAREAVDYFFTLSPP